MQHSVGSASPVRWRLLDTAPAPAAWNMAVDEALAAAGIDVVRRPTGGRAVLHHRELTYSVAAPEEMFGGPRRASA